jgi:hypothetical protein
MLRKRIRGKKGGGKMEEGGGQAGKAGRGMAYLDGRVMDWDTTAAQARVARHKIVHVQVDLRAMHW